MPILTGNTSRAIDKIEHVNIQENVPFVQLERRAWSNHSQTLKELAERGGLSWRELWAVLSNQDFREVRGMEESTAREWCESFIATLNQLAEA